MLVCGFLEGSCFLPWLFGLAMSFLLFGAGVFLEWRCVPVGARGSALLLVFPGCGIAWLWVCGHMLSFAFFKQPLRCSISWASVARLYGISLSERY